jgi:hypothetical protein
MTVKCTNYDSYMTVYINEAGPLRAHSYDRLFNGNRFRQVTRLVNVCAFNQRYVIRKQL